MRQGIRGRTFDLGEIFFCFILRRDPYVKWFLIAAKQKQKLRRFMTQRTGKRSSKKLLCGIVLTEPWIMLFWSRIGVLTVNTRNCYDSMCKSRCSSHNTAFRTETSSTHVVDSTAGQKLCWHCTSAFLHVAHCFPPNIGLIGPKHFSKLRHKNYHFATHFAVTYQSPGTAWLTAETGWTASRSRETSRFCWNRNSEASSWLCFENSF